MRKSFIVSAVAPVLAIVSGLALTQTANADTYNGNGNGGFGGPVGTGSLTVTNGTDTNGNANVTFLFLGGSLHPTLDGNDLVVYLSTGTTGLSDTSSLTDNGDGGREAVSGYNAANSTRTQVNFPTGFQATSAVSIQDGFVGLFHLVNLTSPPSLDYVGANASPDTGVTESSDGGTAPYGDSTTIPLSVLGITPGQSFQFVGTDIATGTYRSNETIGASDAPSDGNIGDNSPLTFSAGDVFVTPEPSCVALLGFAGIIATRRRSTRLK